MKPSAFDYQAPSSLADAVKLLHSMDGEAKIISGGQSLMPMLAFRLAAPRLLVDLKRIPDLNMIGIGGEGVRLGAKVRWCDIAGDRRLHEAHPLLAEAIEHVAHYQIRNRGTVGGSVAHADPSAEMPGVALTCEATLTIIGPNGMRTENASSFFKGSLETSLQPDEILTEVHLPAWPRARRWAFKEFARRKGDFAMAGVAVFYDLDASGLASNAHIGAIGVSDRPIRLSAAEAALNGKRVDDRVIDLVSATAEAEVDPPSDLHAPGEYRRALVATLLARGLKQSIERAS
jgi:carbon-monoxide dehydrogenase medium subunit